MSRYSARPWTIWATTTASSPYTLIGSRARVIFTSSLVKVYVRGDLVATHITDMIYRTGATLEVMPGGEHWFHTPEQMAFLDGWIKKCTKCLL